MSKETREETQAIRMWQSWLGTPLGEAEWQRLAAAVPLLVQGYSRTAPTVFPDGNPTYIPQHLQAVSGALLSELNDASTDGNFAAAPAIQLVMQVLADLDNQPLTFMWLGISVNLREHLTERGRPESLKAVSDALAVTEYWFELNGQSDEFARLTVEASTREELDAIVVMPPNQR